MGKPRKLGYNKPCVPNKRAGSQIPYKDRLMMQRHTNIRDHRDEAARIALQVACVALNDTEGLGYVRLSRFAKRLQELIREYYNDPEVEQDHLEQRLEQMGFVIRDGHMYCLEDLEGNVINKARMEGLHEQDPL